MAMLRCVALAAVDDLLPPAPARTDAQLLFANPNDRPGDNRRPFKMTQPIDLLRAVVPRGLRKPLRRLYELVPLETRMGKDYWRLRSFLEEAERWDRERIESWQLQKLKETLRNAYENVPGYRELYRSAGVRPEDIGSLADIRRLPFTTKELLRDNLKDFTARNISRHRLHYVTTGGSTGIPFGFYRTKTNRWMEYAFQHSGWKRAGWRLGERMAVMRGNFVGTEQSFWEYDSTSRSLMLSSYYMTERTYPAYVDKMRQLQTLNLQAYPSATTMLADLVLKHGDIEKVHFNVILLQSENVYPWQKERLRRAFPNARLFSWYGHAEQVVLAPWCESNETYHAWPFYGLTEILDDETKEVSVGQSGEIVGTSFWNFGVPFIRYRTMDRARKGAYECNECGRQFLILDVIEGRMQEFMVTRSGRRISITAVNMYNDVYDNVRQFQFYQEEPGVLTLRVVGKDSYSEKDTSRIRRALLRKFGDDMEMNIVLVDSIPRSKSGKLKFLEQKLDVGSGD